MVMAPNQHSVLKDLRRPHCLGLASQHLSPPATSTEEKELCKAGRGCKSSRLTQRRGSKRWREVCSER